MRFLFFDSGGAVLFVREDAQSASITHEQLNIRARFPFVQEKEILRGMRIGCEDGTGTFHAFEIRNVKTPEPGHYQEVFGENIAVSELTDEFCDSAEYTDISASAALSPLLTGTGWSIGTVTASGLSSGDVSIGNVWAATRTIQNNWNVYILPRITVDASGITGKYLDVAPAEGTWRGFRLSLDKNANEIGVTWDDSKLKTALYGFGRETNGNPLTFANQTWAQTDEHPAKPYGQTYIEDPDATDAYGRNGRPRFGYYQNAGITDASVLLQKTWETLKTVRVPDVTVDSTVADLYRLGYADVPIRLHDTALVDVRPSGVVLQKEIIQYTEDLINPLQSRITIGTYIPNIIYINRETGRRSGGSGGGASGQSQTPAEYTTENNTVQIGIDSNGLHSLCVGTGAQLNPDGSLVVDENGKPVFIDEGENLFSRVEQNKTNISLEVTNRQNADNTLSGRIDVEAGKITQIVTAVGSNGEVTAASIVTAINDDNTSGVTIEADHIQITGETGILGALTVEGVLLTDDIFTSGGLSATETIYSNAIATNSITVEGDISCQDISADVITTTGSIDCGLNVDVTGTLTVGGDSTLSDIFADSLETTGGVSVGGTVDCTYLDVGSYAGYKVNGTSIGLGDAYKTISLSGPTNNVYTLSATKFDGNSVTIGTFSRATTLSGAWSSGAFTVTATPQGDTLTTSLTNTGHWGNPSVTPGEDENTYYYATKATIGNSATIYDTGNTTTISGLGRYNAGVTEGESHFSLASVTLQGASHTVTPISGGGWYCRTGSTYTVQGSLIRIALYDADGVRYNTNGVNVYMEGTSTVQAASGSFYRYSAGDTLYLYDSGQTYTNTYYTYTG